MEGGEVPAAGGPQRMVVVDSMRRLPQFSDENSESADNHLSKFDDYPEIQQFNIIDVNVAKIITRLGYSSFGKATKWYTKSRNGILHINVAE